MALMQRLELRQGQSLVMTPQLQQAIKLLQMSNLELQAFVESELERNPLLERDERREPSAAAAKPERATWQRADDGAAPRSGSHARYRPRQCLCRRGRADAASRERRGTRRFGLGVAHARRAASRSTSDDFDFGATLTREADACRTSRPSSSISPSPIRPTG